MSGNKLRFMSASDVRRCLSMKEAVGAMREAFMQLSSGRATVPQRIHTELSDHNGISLFMPAYSPDNGHIGLKVVTVSHDNPSKGLPLINGLVTVLDAATGVPLAVMDGAHLTAVRTGAASGLATDLLARKDCEVAAIFGAGAQGRTQLEAVCAVRPIKRAIVFDMNRAAEAKFAEEMSERLKIRVVVAEAVAELAEADVVCTATNSSKPVFEDQDLKPGVHINAVGSYKLTMREIPTETVVRAMVVVDNRESCLAEAGDILAPIKEGLRDESHIHGEIGQIAAGDLGGRSSDDETTLFKSVGNAVQDLAAAGLALENARRAGVGTMVSL